MHRFTTSVSGDVHPAAETQRIQGMVLGYMTRMGSASGLVEAMSQTWDIRWLGAGEALALNLVTAPLGPWSALSFT